MELAVEDPEHGDRRETERPDQALETAGYSFDGGIGEHPHRSFRREFEPFAGPAQRVQGRRDPEGEGGEQGRENP